MGHGFLCWTAKRMSHCYAHSSSLAFYRWLSNWSIRKKGPETFRALLSEYEQSGNRGLHTGAYWVFSYVLEEELDEPAGWDVAAVITLACKIDDSQMVERFLRHGSPAERYGILDGAMDAAPYEPWKIANALGELRGSAKGALPALERWAGRTKERIFRESFQKAIESIEGLKAEKKEERPSCVHHFSWITRSGVACTICERPISAELVSEGRGKACQKCGLAVHVNCQNQLR